MNRKAVIFGIKGHGLTINEKKLFSTSKPWGVILFSRNIKDVVQLKKLIRDIRKIFNDKNYPVLIDQEGGSVSRLNKIIDFSSFSQTYYGQLYNKDKKNFKKKYEIYINTVCDLFKNIGININTVPVLDVKRRKSHNIIGSRAFSSNPSDVIKLGNLCINFYKKNKIGTVIKHMPGHGLSKSDSHYETPIINTNKRELIKKDFKAFKNNKSFFAMTAHVIYSTYDPINTATHSRIVIKEVIRKNIKFKGILISDDISMKALKYNLEENAIKAMHSGCNLVLHCNGNIREMYKLSKVIPKIDKFTEKKTSHFYKFLG